METLDVAIIGGGLGGLAVARGLEGLKVQVFERKTTIGGRATCATKAGFIGLRGSGYERGFLTNIFQNREIVVAVGEEPASY